MSELAIVIPAYKENYFDETLNSISRQTNKNFTVYIGDDCSPFDLKQIADRYKDQFSVVYTRFANNIGPRNLVSQWKRCIALTQQEKWLWLFSDDDLMDENCVANFYKIIEEKQDAFDVYRFNTITIDQHSEVTNKGIKGPKVESSAEMAFHLLKGERGNSMPDHIFSRNIYNKCGGFVFTEYAQGADWATSILFSKENGICIIPDPNVYWRYSGINISSTASANKSSMINGHLQFINWTLNHFQYLKTSSSNITYEMMMAALRINLKMVMLYHYKGFDYSQTLRLLTFHYKTLNYSFLGSIKELMDINGIHFPTVRRLKRLIVNAKRKLL